MLRQLICRSGLWFVLLASRLMVQTANIQKLDAKLSVCSEGPLWDVKTQSLFLVDIGRAILCKYTPAKSSTIQIKAGLNPVAWMIPVKDKPDHFVIGEKLDVVQVHWDTTKNQIWSKLVLMTLPETCKNRFNDAKCDAKGRLWSGTMSDFKPVEKGAGSFYSFANKEGLKTHLKNISISNGMAFSADNKKLWYIDSLKKMIDEYDFDIDQAKITFVKTFFDFAKKDIKGAPDGMTLDTNGNLWVACYNSGQVLHINSKTGELIQSIKFPDTPLTCGVCFGGPNLDELYVTTADEEPTLANPDVKFKEGVIYRVTGLGVKGYPGTDFDFDL